MGKCVSPVSSFMAAISSFTASVSVFAAAVSSFIPDRHANDEAETWTQKSGG
ncbi:hypothetical protein [Bhargavaea massiliensis]|uniref:hypothetical protein n=1 Tax=Bhargavaea massiliensis TaxID=2697500 RepID=UPI001BD15FC7|nr:hypothetical protein [Bhargavaea massiliensis]